MERSFDIILSICACRTACVGGNFYRSDLWHSSRLREQRSRHEANRIYGYLPAEVQTMIADELDIPLAEVYGVATFYSQFSLKPKGKHRISVCLGTACYVKGADKVLSAVEKELRISCGELTPDRKFSLDSCRCVGACGLAPVMIVDDEVYGRLTEKQVKAVLDKYIKE